MMVILPVSRILPRVVQIEPQAEGPQRFIFLSEIIKLCAGELFPGYRRNAAHAFRVTRNSDLYIDEEEAENLLNSVSSPAARPSPRRSRSCSTRSLASAARPRSSTCSWRLSTCTRASRS